MRISVTDFDTVPNPPVGVGPVQGALDAAQNGDAVYFPAGRVYTCPANGWVVTKSLEIYGDGAGGTASDSGSVLKPQDKNGHVFKIIPPVERVYIHDLQLRGPGFVPSGTGIGILCQGVSGNAVSDIALARLAVTDFPSHGISIEGVDGGSNRIARFRAIDSVVQTCGGIALRLVNVIDAYLANLVLRDNQMNGLAAIGCGFAAYACVFDRNCQLSSWSASANPYEGSAKIEDCVMTRLEACRFANVQAGNVRKGCVIRGSGGAVIGACYFLALSGFSAVHGIVVTPSAGPIAVLSNRHRYIDIPVLVEIDPATGDRAKDCVIFPQYSEAGTTVISLPYPGPNEGMFGAAHLSTPLLNKLTGLLIPSSANDPTQALREGMLAFNTTGQVLRLYTGGRWQSVQTQ